MILLIFIVPVKISLKSLNASRAPATNLDRPHHSSGPEQHAILIFRGKAGLHS
jgi:hypothetical protein